MKNTFKIINGDCLEVMKTMPDNSVDSIVTDPPYGLSFMGKAWDKGVPSSEVWKEALRVLKPGGHLLAFAGTRTQHRMATAIEDAGFEIRDMIAWVYGSGFPKSHDISKAIDKAAGAEREVIEERTFGGRSNKAVTSGASNGGVQGGYNFKDDRNITAPATDSAKQWEGWGTALKPALEPITVARKPFSGTVAQNVLTHGTGAINIDGCRVGESGARTNSRKQSGEYDTSVKKYGDFGSRETVVHDYGRFPANFIHDGGYEVKDLLKDSARFFYCPKANRKDRNEGLEEFEEKASTERKGNGLDRVCNICGVSQLKPCDCENNTWIVPAKQKNHHPTVKPTDLMAYLCRLVTPKGGTVLDPFNGSGSTGKAAIREGFSYIGIELDPEYVAISEARIKVVVPPIKVVAEPEKPASNDGKKQKAFMF